MLKEAKLFVVLASVTTLISCYAASLDNGSRPLIEVEMNGRLFKVPIYENVVYTEAKRQLDAEKFGEIKARVLEVIVQKNKSYLTIAKKAMGFLGIFHNYLKASAELAKTDPSPAFKKTFGPDMSRLADAILKTKADSSNLSKKEVYERIELLMNGIEKLAQKSPVGLYLDWTKLTIDGEALPEFLAPTVDWVRSHGYGVMLRVLSMLSGFFKNMGGRSE